MPQTIFQLHHSIPVCSKSSNLNIKPRRNQNIKEVANPFSSLVMQHIIKCDRTFGSTAFRSCSPGLICQNIRQQGVIDHNCGHFNHILSLLPYLCSFSFPLQQRHNNAAECPGQLWHGGSGVFRLLLCCQDNCVAMVAVLFFFHCP